MPSLQQYKQSMWCMVSCFFTVVLAECFLLDGSLALSLEDLIIIHLGRPIPFLVCVADIFGLLFSCDLENDQWDDCKPMGMY